MENKKNDATANLPAAPLDADDLTLILVAVEDVLYCLRELGEYFGSNDKTPKGQAYILRDFASSGVMTRAAELFALSAREQLLELGARR